jgi:protein phosphatase 1G
VGEIGNEGCIEEEIDNIPLAIMGPGLVYLTEPNREKVSQEGETAEFKFCATGMQGWRINMEDAHLAVSSFGGDPTAALFSVFDGHGGELS